MYLRYGFLVLVYYVMTGLSLPATSYDQRQTGDLNVQVHLKDIQVLALLDSELLDDYTEYDYFYDYADFTVKPIVKPTTSTTQATISASESIENVDVAETADSSSQNSTLLLTNDSSNVNSTAEVTEISIPADTEERNETLATLSLENPENPTNEVNALKTRINDETSDLFDVDEEDSAEKKNEGSAIENPLKKFGKRCRSGYSPNGKGRCRRLSQRRLSLIPLAMRLAPKLLDDLSRNTRNLAQIEVDRTHSN
ncbi:hypothetical protein ANTRET_LOCUS1104 [Anthophora retusa]